MHWRPDHWRVGHAPDVASVLLIFGLAATAVLTFRDYGISNDEGLQQHYGELILAYYRSGFSDESVFRFDNLYYYGGLFDIVVVLIGGVVPADPYSIRHLLCAFAGIGGILATWAIARAAAGPRAGFLAGLALALCGPWYGGMFNHTKDIPFAAAMIGATYFLLRARRSLPYPKWQHVLGFGLLAGMALGIRVQGLLLFAYAALMISWWPHQSDAGLRERARSAGTAALRFAPAFLIAYLIMVSAWPWAALDALNPLRALNAFQHFHYDIKTIASGEMYVMATVPRWYVPLYLAVKLHVLMLVGAIVAVLGLALPRTVGIDPLRKDTRLIALTVAFPLLCQVATQGPAYTGLRHFLFVVPALAALAGIGIDLVLNFMERRRRAVANGAAVALAATCVWYATVLVRLHPDEYLFYNPLVGGLERASGRYETDYWFNTMPEALKELDRFLARTDKSYAAGPWPKYKVTACSQRLQFEEQAGVRFEWTTDWDQADFYIAPTHMDCDRVLDGKIIATVERLGATIAVVKDRRLSTTPSIAHQ